MLFIICRLINIETYIHIHSYNILFIRTYTHLIYTIHYTHTRIHTYIGKATVSQWIDFLNQLSYIQYINITTLNECEKTALLLNLYHIMIIHVSLIIGPPASWAR